ncbi:hypothetical protein GCM10011578_099460 [Streptomyces fuscichromogenes]|uniref:Uncharacterized protein n=1 Tax=Streptomyces fuscichromogenes TaxID=1324013 RepID=A0A917XPT7_9ACTN|nr:hypothetical protein GCM10011578_099460 [Streptomyces fuscichromogenes]
MVVRLLRTARSGRGAVVAGQGASARPGKGSRGRAAARLLTPDAVEREGGRAVRGGGEPGGAWPGDVQEAGIGGGYGYGGIRTVAPEAV